jgi:hypothetical protein
MVMLKDQMFRRQPTMFAGGTPNRLNDPRTAIGVAQGGGLNAPAQTIGGAFGGMLPPVSMPVNGGAGGLVLPKNVTNEMVDDFSRRQIEFNQNNLNKYGGDRLQTFNAFTQANPNLNPYLVNEYRNTLGRGNDMIAFGNTGFDTTLPTQAPVAAPTTVGLTGIPSAPSSVGAGEVALGGVLGGLLGGGIDLQNVLGTAGQAYLGQEAISAPYEIGRAGLEMAEQVGQRGAETAAFRPYTVTSNLARVGTDPSGGFTTQLSPEQQALQNQIMGQAGGFFSQLQADPAAVQAGIYEDLRATQRPEEERQRLALEERMLSQGRLGLSSDAYGGASPELLAMETARQEAMARANIGARQQALAEQAQTASLAGGLLGSGYIPQNQALSLLQASQIPAGYADIGRRTGAELGAKSGLAGIEALLQGTQLSQEAQLQLNKDLLASIAGRQDPTTGSFGGGLLGGILQNINLPSWLGGSTPVSSSTNQALNSLINSANTMPSFAQRTATPQAPPMLGQSGFLSSIALSPIPKYTGGSISAALTPPPIPTPGQPINLGNLQAPANFGYQLPPLPII